MANGKDDEVAERRGSHIDLSGKINNMELTLATGFSEMRAQHVLLNRDLSVVSAQQTRIFESLYGNGHEGIITKVAKINQRVAIIWTVMWAIGAIGVSILGYLAKGLADQI